ncbi:VTT domain-containing protein [Solimicrobium silvestre]|uniref:Putative membrane-associated protein n=1 Tax=Solimicrobium silvestre TaxID=2099400 RepID=A0A2S9H0S3_9BURK|nr:VTT domain-containing protein [Solimicrobium silvestre]PRC93582.1 putative membrane-associated protein [Solimicrobium silvestre]
MDFMQFFNMILHVDKTLGLFIAQYGTLIYVILFAIVFCETGLIVLPFLPGDSLLFIAGTFCATGAIDPWLLCVLLITAAILGNTVNYWVGSAIGHKVYERDYAWLDKDALKKTHSFYEKHGGKTIVLARFIPIVRTFAPFVAGVSDMTHKNFQIFNVIGAVIWVVLLVMAGFFLGDIPILRDHLNTVVLIGVGAAVVPLLLGAAWKLFKNLTAN